MRPASRTARARPPLPDRTIDDFCGQNTRLHAPLTGTSITRRGGNEDSGESARQVARPAHGGSEARERHPGQASELKKDLKVGRARIDKILNNPPEYVATAKVFDMLMAVPKFGRVKAARFLNQARISQSKTVGGLSDRQRTELIGLFHK